MTSLRLILGFAVSVAVGFIVLRLQRPPSCAPARWWAAKPRHGTKAHGSQRHHGSGGENNDFAGIGQIREFRKKILLATSRPRLILDVTFFLILGAVFAASFNTVVKQEVILPFASNTPVAIASLMILRSLLSICSTTDASSWRPSGLSFRGEAGRPRLRPALRFQAVLAVQPDFQNARGHRAGDRPLHRDRPGLLATRSVFLLDRIHFGFSRSLRYLKSLLMNSAFSRWLPCATLAPGVPFS